MCLAWDLEPRQQAGSTLPPRAPGDRKGLGYCHCIPALWGRGAVTQGCASPITPQERQGELVMVAGLRSHPGAWAEGGGGGLGG